VSASRGRRRGGREIAGRAVKTAAVLVDRLVPPQPGVVVLIYHRVGGHTDIEVDLPEGLFDEQMAWLASRGIATSIEDALDAVGRPGEPERDRVVVTFDDGTADLVDVALPILVEHQVPAVFYLATDFVERGRPFPHGGLPLSWAAVREATATGLVTIGSHTHTHALLDRLDPRSAADELDRSVDLVAERVGAAARHFAYPKAVAPSPAVEALVRDRFRSAALGGSRPNPYGRTDPHRLARSAVQRSDGMRYFEHKAAGGMAFEDGVRRALNRVRYARATQ
jgi:peptidoglycan/xylan/chitin deacetylase (PgdA/CDA1 family)